MGRGYAEKEVLIWCRGSRIGWNDVDEPGFEGYRADNDMWNRVSFVQRGECGLEGGTVLDLRIRQYSAIIDVY